MTKKKIPVVDLVRCNDCESCLQTCPQVFKRNKETGLIEIRDLEDYPEKEIQEAISLCPGDCISWEDRA